jgi:hypothetical protein
MTSDALSPFGDAPRDAAVERASDRSAATRASALALPWWLALAIATGARVVLLTAACLLLGAAAPALWGWSPTTVVSGSMQPRIVAGDVVVAMPVAADALDVGQVLLVDDPDRPGELRLHRLVDVTDDGLLRLRGDANATADSTLVSPDAVHGAGVLRVPGIGSAMLWSGGERALGIGVVSLAVLVLLALTRLEPRDEDDVVDPLALGRHRARPPVTGWGRARRVSGVVVGVVAGVAVLFLVVGSTHAGFAGTTASAATATTSRFPCFDRTVPSPAHFAYLYADGASGPVRDSGPSRRDGTLVGGAQITSATCSSGENPYLRLDGATGQVTTPEQLLAPQVFTIETWFRTSTTTGGKLVGFGNARTTGSGQYDRHLYLTNAGQLVFGVYRNQPWTVTSPSSYTDDRWHQATISMGPDGIVMYVDGAAVASSSQTQAEPITGYWRIGYDTLAGAWPSVPTSAHYKGDLDGTIVYDAALTASQVADRYAAGR